MAKYKYDVYEVEEKYSLKDTNYYNSVSFSSTYARIPLYRFYEKHGFVKYTGEASYAFGNYYLLNNDFYRVESSTNDEGGAFG